MVQPNSEASPLFAGAGAGTLRLVAYLVVAVVLMIADHRGGYLSEVRSYASLLTGPLYWLAAAPPRAIDAVRATFGERRELSRENARLRENLLLAEARLARLGAVQEQNSRLRGLLDARARLGLKVQLAELLEVDLDPFRHRLMIDRGSADGVAAGQAVMDARGLMGQVLEVYPMRSQVILITDPSHAVPVRVLRNGVRTIAFGTGHDGELHLPHVPFSADIRAGDVLVTSGLGGGFPAGLPVGTVRAVEPDDSATFLLARALPSAEMARGGEVLVLYDEREVLTAPDHTPYEFVGPPEPPRDADRQAAGGRR